jgi:phytoene/squalene synthetase
VVLRNLKSDAQTHRSYLAADDQSRATTAHADEPISGHPSFNPEHQKVR